MVAMSAVPPAATFKCAHPSSSHIAISYHRYDNTVRNATGDVIQFLYGEDGMDGAAIEGQHLASLRLNEAKLRCGPTSVAILFDNTQGQRLASLCLNEAKLRCALPVTIGCAGRILCWVVTQPLSDPRVRRVRTTAAVHCRH